MVYGNPAGEKGDGQETRRKAGTVCGAAVVEWRHEGLNEDERKDMLDRINEPHG